MPPVLKQHPPIDDLITLLRAACSDAGMNRTLEKLLSQPHELRQGFIHELLAGFETQEAPQQLIDAFVPLLDEDLADTAWRVIYQCGA